MMSWWQMHSQGAIVWATAMPQMGYEAYLWESSCIVRRGSVTRRRRKAIAKHVGDNDAVLAGV